MRRRALVGACIAIVTMAAGTATAPMATGKQASAAPVARDYLIIATGTALPANLDSRVGSAGGVVTQRIPEIGVAVASSASASFASSLRGTAGIRSVSSSPKMRRITPGRTVQGPSVDFADPPTSGDDDFFFDLQWGHDAVDAVEAWNAGQRGQGHARGRARHRLRPHPPRPGTEHRRGDQLRAR